MSVLRAIYRFLFEFIIGDDWKIAVAVAVALTAGLALLAAGVPTGAAVLGTAALIAASFVAAIVIDVRGAKT